MPADEFTLFIATDLDAPKVLELMGEELGLSLQIKEYPGTSLAYPQPYYIGIVRTLDSLVLKGRGVSVRSVSYSREQYSELPTLFGMIGISNRPDRHVEISFHILSSDYNGNSYMAILRAIGAILRRVDGDCIFVMTGHFLPGLVRKNEQVAIDPVTWGWNEKERQALNVPLTIDNFPQTPDPLAG